MEKFNTNFDKLNNVKIETTAADYLKQTSLQELKKKVKDVESVTKLITDQWDSTAPVHTRQCNLGNQKRGSSAT